MMPPRQVWITGIGTCSPLGDNPLTFQENLLAGRSGIRRVSGFGVDDHPSQIAGQVSKIPCPPGDHGRDFANLSRLDQITRHCVRQALEGASLWPTPPNLRIGLVLGLGGEWLLHWEADGLKHPTPPWIPPLQPDSVLSRTQRFFGMTGPTLAVSAACASGNMALWQARSWIRMGLADICVAGACDMGVSPMSLAGFGNLRALSRKNQDPPAASRPFDRQRDGFVLSEGGAIFVVESAEGAQARGVEGLAEILGYGAASDAHHMVIPSPDPAPAVTAMRMALEDAHLQPSQVDYVNAHATSTPVGDLAEARVLAEVFGKHLPDVPVSATKSITGHLLTGAAALEALACIVAMKEGRIPPTLNLDDPEPEVPLCHVPHMAREHSVRVAVSNSFGFGGSNTCLVLRAV